jgi:uncharacterized protein YeaO (DUF488 family)
VQIQLKRAYDPPAPGDGCRVLVDRIWPRGIARDDLRIDAWLKELAPSAGLRKWFGHDPKKWEQFKERYARELEKGPDGLAQLVGMAKGGRLTLVFGARDTEHNNAVALREYLERVPSAEPEGLLCRRRGLAGLERSVA